MLAGRPGNRNGRKEAMGLRSRNDKVLEGEAGLVDGERDGGNS